MYIFEQKKRLNLDHFEVTESYRPTRAPKGANGQQKCKRRGMIFYVKKTARPQETDGSHKTIFVPNRSTGTQVPANQNRLGHSTVYTTYAGNLVHARSWEQPG
jgi:hypothetical protein